MASTAVLVSMSVVSWKACHVVGWYCSSLPGNGCMGTGDGDDRRWLLCAVCGCRDLRWGSVQRVAAIAEAMASRSKAPVTVKCRIGVDDYDTYDHLC